MKIFNENLSFQGNFLNLMSSNIASNQAQTADVFSEKWTNYAKNVDLEEQQKLWDFQKEWYLKLYGFDSEDDLASFLQQQEIIFDAGCGLGYLSEWFARLSPQSTIIAMDISDSVEIAAFRYRNIPNIYFIKGDIAKTPFRDGVVDYVSCHAVIMHTEDPDKTFCELSRILKSKNSLRGGGAFCVLCVCKKGFTSRVA